MTLPDPCEEADRLRRIRTAIITGDGVAAARFGQDEMRYFQADMERLERLLGHYEDECARAQGKRPRRRRFAKTVRIAPH